MKKTFLALCLSEVIFLSVIQYVYDNVLDIKYMCSTLIVLFFFNCKLYKIKGKKILFLFCNLFILIGIPLIVLIHKPEYTYNEAVGIIKSNLSTPFEIEKDSANINYKSNPSFLVNKGYLITVTIDNTKITYLFSPITGTYRSINIK